MSMVTVPVIRTDKDLQLAIDRVAELWGAASGTPEGDELEVLTVLVHAYEREHFPIPPPHPVDAIRFVMDERGLSQRDLIRHFGSASHVSEFLSGKRQLSIEQIRRLYEAYHIPLECLVASEPYRKAG